METSIWTRPNERRESQQQKTGFDVCTPRRDETQNFAETSQEASTKHPGR